MVEIAPAQVVGTGGAIGALLRHFVGEWIDIQGFPVATFTVNVLGTFALGFATFLSIDDTLMLLFGTGLCGSFTTFSSFAFQTVRLWETGERGRAVLNAVGNLAGAGVALALAWGLVQLIA